MTIESPDRDLISIQMLRAIAATMVVFVHMDVHLQRLGYPTLGAGWMASGVDIFFVVSGFIMWTSVERRPGITAGSFIRNRLIRIVPLYWLATTVVVLVGLIAPQILNTTVVRPWHAIASYLFIPARHPIKAIFWPLLIPGWSLNYEMLFYLIFAIAIALGRQVQIARALLIAGLLGAVLVLARATKSELDIMNFYANPVLLEFLAGVGLGIWWRANKVRRSWLWLPVTALGFVGLWVGAAGGVGFALVALGAMIVVAGAIFLPPLPHNPLSTLGDASYSLYLTHVMSLSVIALVWRRVFHGLDWRLFILTGLAVSIVAAMITYRAFEVPMTSALKRYYARRPGTMNEPIPAGHR